MLSHALLLSTATRLLRRDDDGNDWQDEGDTNCVKAVPGRNGNVPITACNSYYNYDPQFAPAVAVAVIFGVFTAAHLVEGVVFKKVCPLFGFPIPAGSPCTRPPVPRHASSLWIRTDQT